MATNEPSFTLGPNPKWYFVDNFGAPAGGGTIYLGDSLNPTNPKPVFQDPGGVIPWPLDAQNRVDIDENGTQGPFYFEFDPANPDSLYFIQVFDINGNELWSINNYIPSAAANGGGGGGTIVEAFLIDNLIINNSFWRAETSVITPTVNTVIAPSNHAGFAPVSGTNGGGLPDIRFIKSNATSTDALTVTPFTYGDTPFLTTDDDITPAQYLNFTCSVAGTGETFKYVQFPITTNLQNLSNYPMIGSLWAEGVSGDMTLQVGILQYFGDGAGASAPLITFFETINLNAGWQKVTPIQGTVPSVSSKTRGYCKNDALYLIVGYPLNATCNINFTSPALFPGTIIPSISYQPYDKIDSIVNAARTGQVIASGNAFAPYGWILMNDGYIGSPSSLGAMPSVARANFDTFPLYDLLWNKVSFPTANAFCPVVGGLGASSIADFTANKPLQLMLQVGRAISAFGAAAGVGVTNFLLGQFAGEELHVLMTRELPNPLTTEADIVTVTAPGAVSVISNSAAAGGTGTIANSSGGFGHNTVQPTTYYNVLIKL
jgi:hypothetical protein